MMLLGFVRINWELLGIIACIWVSYNKPLIPLYNHYTRTSNNQPFLPTKQQIGKLTLKTNIIYLLLGYGWFSINGQA